MSNVETYNLAISERIGKIKFFLSKSNNVEHRIYRGPDTEKEIEVESCSLDEFFDRNGGKCHLIKLDIEGAEPVALRGMKRTIERADKIILFTEFVPALLKLCGFDPVEYLKDLRRLGLKIRYLRDSKIWLSDGSLERLDLNFNYNGYVDLVCEK